MLRVLTSPRQSNGLASIFSSDHNHHLYHFAFDNGMGADRQGTATAKRRQEGPFGRYTAADSRLINCRL
jgi:hypothetical protein